MVESNVFFGTAFPQQTERDKRLGTTDSGQFLPAWKQEARDEQGRRRFHGAFTGGFSAGYFNTVGSKEGWTPSQFVSSRSSRGEQKVAKIEDFMDEEDLQDLASTKRLVTTDEFDTMAETEKEWEKRRQQQLDNDAKKHGGGGGDMTFLTSSLMNLVAPAEDSTGMRLLRKMGWRPGQGVGPRTAFVKDDDDDDDNGYLQQMTLAPKDTPIVDYQPKTNTFGLGYDLMQHVPQVAEMRRFQQQQQDQQQQQRQSSRSNVSTLGGFSLGVFDNDHNEDDDMALYDDDASGLSRNYHHTLYDDNDYNNNGTWSAKKKKKSQQGDQITTKKARCSDGHPPLKGFHLSSQPQEIGTWYPPPSVPANFDGMHTQQQQRSSISKKTTTTHESNSSITIDARGAMLGETPIEARSVFDYMSSKTKDRLAQAKLAATATAPPLMDKTRLQVTLIPKDMAQLALRGFIPFGDTPEKQARYRHFLEASVNTTTTTMTTTTTTNTNTNTPTTATTTTFDIPPGMTHEAGMKELDEFTQAARIFRPISSMMSGRFTTSSTPTTPTTTTTTHNIEQVSFEGGLKTEEQWKKEKEIREKQVMDEPKPKLSQEAEAAAMNMFGPMTRTQHPFYPNRLLCKRFNVRNPHPDHVPQGPGHRTQAGSTSALDEKAMASMLAPQPHNVASTNNNNKKKPLAIADTQHDDPALRAIIPKPSSRTPTEEKEGTKASIENGAAGDSSNSNKNEEEEEDALDYERPGMDIFKAIFDTSDDDDDEDENDYQQSTSLPVPPSTTTMMDVNDDNDLLIGPPAPPSSSSATDHHHHASSPPPPSSEPATTTTTPFRPMFTKRASQDTKRHAEQAFVVTPFESRLSSSSSHKKRTTPRQRRVSVSSDSEEKNDHASDEDDKEKKRRHRHHSSSSSSRSSKKRKDNKEKDTSSGRKKRKHPSDSDDEQEARHRRRRHRRHDGDDDDSHHDQKKRSHHHHHRSSSRNSTSHHHQQPNDEADLSLWVEKQPQVSRRSRAEDLW